MLQNNVIIFLLLMPFVLISQDKKQDTWINDQMASMSLEEKVGQLFMIRAHSNLGADHIKSVKEQIEKYHVGGLCFFQGTPSKQAELTNDYQELSKVPLMVAIDAEWGLGMRFKDDAISFPRQMALGAIQDDNLIYQMGAEVAKQLRRIGVQVNFAPVVDVNNNAANPVINYRSFGEDPIQVAQKSYSYMKGMQDNGVMACAKHFPGHGDTDVDSHLDLPVINFDRKRLDSLELLPFKMLSDQGVQSMMVAHMQLPQIDDRPNRPATLSKKIVTDLLRNEIGFDGLLFTDAMEMKGVAKHFKNGDADLEAFLAGNDIIVLPENMEISYQKILTSVQNGTISTQRLDASVRRILESKSALGLKYTPKIFDPKKATEDVNNKSALELKEKLIRSALTLVKNDQNIVPIPANKYKNIATVSIGEKVRTDFQKHIEKRTRATHIQLAKSTLASERASWVTKLKAYDLVVISLHDLSQYKSKAFGLNTHIIKFVNELSAQTKTVLVHFGSPYALSKFEPTKNILLAFDEDPLTQKVAVDAIFGSYEISGKLPVTSSPAFKKGQGLFITNQKVLGYGTPESVGLSTEKLNAIDTIVAEMIKVKAAPGCQVLVAKDRKIVFHKSYGHHTYDKKRKTKVDDVFDLASVTKIMASTISLMHLQDQNKFSVYQPLSNYVTNSDTSNKADMILEDVLTHHAGLKPWIPFYNATIDTVKNKIVPKEAYYRESKSDSFPIKVADQMFLRFDYPDTIWSRILASGLRDTRDYRYSDLGLYMANEIIKNVSGEYVDAYADSIFYKPLGLKTTGFNPLNHLDKTRIPPTEKDNYFRNQTVHGHVHDMGAAMLGGVSGHAGLFSNSYDLAILMQMLLNGGEYNGKRYLKAKTVKDYTKRYYRSTRRGLGFDLKELDPDARENMSEKATENTFGHLGFTGIAAFADPDNDIIYIFLSNRTYPTMKNNKFGKNNYRPRVQTAIYDALLNTKA